MRALPGKLRLRLHAKPAGKATPAGMADAKPLAAKPAPKPSRPPSVANPKPAVKVPVAANSEPPALVSDSEDTMPVLFDQSNDEDDGVAAFEVSYLWLIIHSCSGERTNPTHWHSPLIYFLLHCPTHRPHFPPSH